MENWKNTRELDIEWITIPDSDDYLFYKVGLNNVTKIIGTNKNGYGADIPYVQVYVDEQVVFEVCQHMLSGVSFKQN